MAVEAIALVVIGSGEVTDDEVNDLLTDAYPNDIEIGLIIPVDRDLFSDAVQAAVDWFDNDDDVFTVQTEGASMTKSASKLGSGTEKVDKFTDFLTPDEFKDWDEVHVLIAMPEDPDSDEYDFYAEIAEVATEAGFKVKDLTAGLDDIVMTDAEDGTADEPAEEEPEEKPAPKRGRGRKAAEEPEESQADKVAEDTAAAATPKRSRKKAETIEEIMAESKQDAEPLADVTSEAKGEVLEDRVRGLELQVAGLSETLSSIANALTTLGDRLAEARAGAVEKVLETTVEEPAAEEAKTSTRGRGRPRTNFEVKQVWDEDDEAWIPRPAGRLKRGTEWRTIHAETSEVLDEGKA